MPWNRRWPAPWAVAVAAALAVALAAPALAIPASAAPAPRGAGLTADTPTPSPKDYYWQSFDVDLTVQRDGSLRVVETQRYVFTLGTFHHGYRWIPLRAGQSIRDVQVSDGGQPYRLGAKEQIGAFTAGATDDENGRRYAIDWWFPETARQTRTFTVAYTVLGGLWVTDEFDEVDWKAIFKEQRDKRIDSAKVTIRLPPGATAAQLRATSSGVPATGQVVDGATVVFTAKNLPPGEEMEVRVDFPHGLTTATKAAWQEQEEWQRQWNATYRAPANLGLGALALFILVGGLVGLTTLWFSRGRDHPAKLVAEYLSDPPDALPAGLAGVLLDERADMRDVLATLVDLARRGVLRFREVNPREQLQAASTVPTGILKTLLALAKAAPLDYQYELAEPGAPLRQYERTLVQALFPAGQTAVLLSSLGNRVHRYLSPIWKGMYADLVAGGYFPRSPETTRTRYAIAGYALAGLAAVIAFQAQDLLGLGRYTDVGWSPFVAVALIGFGLGTLSSRMPRKTEQGALAAAKWRAFRRYLEHLQKYTDVQSATDLFDRYLPYAVAFGLDREFVQQFAAAGAPAPGWYIPYGGHHSRGDWSAPSDSAGLANGLGGAPSLQGMSDGLSSGLQGISDGLSSMLNLSASAFTPPSSSGSSSGGGGGGGGGGSGGGGGGAN